MSGLSSAVVATNALTADQQGLWNYVGAWSQLSLSQALWNPLSTKNLAPEMQAGIAQSLVLPEGLERVSASKYVQRAKVYERSLLTSLGVDPRAIESFVDGDIPYGDYFSDPLHVWQEDGRFAERVVGQMEKLHEAIGVSKDAIALWGRSYRSEKGVGTFQSIREGLGVERVLGDPLSALQKVLAENVGRARWVLRSHGMTEEGLFIYFQVPHSRQSGTFPRPANELIDLRAFETVAPPPAA